MYIRLVYYLSVSYELSVCHLSVYSCVWYYKIGLPNENITTTDSLYNKLSSFSLPLDITYCNNYILNFIDILFRTTVYKRYLNSLFRFRNFNHD